MRWGLAAAMILTASAAPSQPFPRGYVDPAPILAGANRAIGAWRWEIGEAGRDGPTVKPEKVNVVSITKKRKAC